MGISKQIIQCSVCGETKTHEARGLCKSCYNKSQREKNCEEYNEYAKQYRCSNKEKVLNYRKQYRSGENRERYLKLKRDNYKKNKKMKYIDNKNCSIFLGVHVAERILSHTFKEVENMPMGNIGYDFICNKGKKIDVKSATLSIKRKETHSDNWIFKIKKNTIADHFLCIAFDNRTDLTSLHIWLIPSGVVSHLQGLSISESKLNKWKQYELDINQVLDCCNEIKK